MFRSYLQTEPALPLLITGIAGVAGYNALAYFRARYPGQVIGIRQHDNWRLSGPDIIACNAEDHDGLERLFDEFQFGAVLNCAGNCALKSCELDATMAWRINVEGVENLLRLAVPRGVRIVHLSVDLVFSGLADQPYVETAPTDPVTIYGKTMVAAEDRVAAADPGACQLRISLPMGVSFNGHAGAIDWIQSRFRKNRPATLYYDEVRTPAYTDCLNHLFEAALVTPLAGIYNAGGSRRMSLYQIAQVINRVGGYNPKTLMGCLRQQAGPMPPRAGDVSLDSSKLATDLGYDPLAGWPYDEALVPTHTDWHFERPQGEDHSYHRLTHVLYCNPARGELARPEFRPHA